MPHTVLVIVINYKHILPRWSNSFTKGHS